MHAQPAVRQGRRRRQVRGAGYAIRHQAQPAAEKHRHYSQPQVIRRVGSQHGLDQLRTEEHQDVGPGPAFSVATASPTSRKTLVFSQVASGFGRLVDTRPFSTERNQGAAGSS
jgi:hypothetical protein